MRKYFSKHTILVLSICCICIWSRLCIKAESKKISIDQTFVINLDKSKDRYASVKRILDSAGIKYRRLSASFGADLDIENENGARFKGKDVLSGKAKFEFDKTYKITCWDDMLLHYNMKKVPKLSLFRKKYIKESMRFPTIGELGCTCSHLRVLQEIVKNKYQHSLVFEDDFVPVDPSTFKSEIDLVAANFPKNCDLIYLFHDKHGFEKIDNKIRSAFQYGYMKDKEYMTDAFYGLIYAVSYIISYDAAKKILDDIERNGFQNMPIDINFSAYFIKKGIIKGCISNKPLIEHGKFISDIGYDRVG